MELAVKDAQAAVDALEAASGLVHLLRETVPSGTRDFDAEYLGPVRALAQWVLELPAAPDHHAEPGGLLRYAVQAGYFALRLAEGAVFGGEMAAETRRVVERESRRAAFLAALISPLCMPHRYLVVTSVQGEVWSEFSRPATLADWARERGNRYRIAWRQQPHEPARAVAVWLAGNLIGAHLNGMSDEVAREAMVALAPEERAQGQESALQKVVRQALAKSAETGRKAMRGSYNAPASVTTPSADELRSLAAPPPEPAVPSPKPASHVGEADRIAAANDSPATAVPAQPELVLAGGEVTSPTAALSPALRQLLDALREDIQAKEAVRRRLRWDEGGKWLLVDLNLLGAYGMAPASVASALKRARLAEDGNGRTLRLAQALGRMLVTEGA